MVDRRRGIGVFSMHRNDIGTGFGKLVDLVHQRGVGDHQMDMHRLVGQWPDLGNQVGNSSMAGEKCPSDTSA